MTTAAARGTSYGAPTVGEVDLAEEVSRRIPSVEMLRMTSSGTEAAMSAIRLARAATGREKLLKFAGAYHGHVDGLLADAGSGLATQGIPASPGVPAQSAAATIIVPWNDADAVRAAVAEHEFAAILAEPFPANMGLVPPAEGFLELLREAATENGALLVFDEVISGFRVAPGGAQELTGVLPDLTVMGKVIGGGLPAAAYGGSRELMERIAPAGDVYQAGTLSGNPLAVAAGLATLHQLDESAYLRLASTTEALANGLAEAAGDHPVQVVSTTGLVTLFFTDTPVIDYEDAKACDTELYGAWCRALLAPRCVSAAVAVRGMVPVAGTHARAGEQNDRGGRGCLRGVVTGADPIAALAARGPRVTGHAETVEAAITAVRDGARRHYAADPHGDLDLELLQGDAGYAEGLSRLADTGDLVAIAELAEVISLHRGRARRGGRGARRGRLGGRRGRDRLGPDP